MTTTVSPHPDEHRRASTVRWILWAFALIGAYFLITEHPAHLFEYLPYVLLLACPLLHMFHGHGARRSADADASGKVDKAEMSATQRQNSGSCH